MHRLSRLSFVRQAPFAQLYVVGTNLCATSATAGNSRRIGSLEADAAVLNRSLCHPTAPSNGADPHRWLTNLCFCVEQLLPLVKAVEDQTANPSPCCPDILAEIERLEDRFSRSSSKAPAPKHGPVTAEMLALWLGAPCAILRAGVIVPLEQADASESTGDLVVCEGIPYRRQWHQSRPMRDVLASMSRNVGALFAGRPDAQAELSRVMPDVDAHIGPLLDKLRAVNLGSHWVLHAGGDYQLHYGARRFYILRGPFLRRNNQMRMYVAAEIQGLTRTERLAALPHRLDSADALWHPSSHGTTPVCMGSRAQFHHLLSNKYADAEAMLLYLDAAADLATGRSSFHLACRKVIDRTTAKFDSKLRKRLYNHVLFGGNVPDRFV